MKFMLKAEIQFIFVLLFNVNKSSTETDWYYDVDDNNVILLSELNNWLKKTNKLLV